MSDDEDDYVYEDDHEEYVYTDNDDDCQDESESHFNIPDAGYKILECVDVSHMMDSYLTEMSELFGVTPDVAQALLQQYKWNKERLVDAFYSDPDGTLTAAHTSRHLGTPPEVSDMECRICGTVAPPSDFFGLGCGHFFCRVCYGEYLSVHISEGPVCVMSHCPEFKCKHAIARGVVASLCTPERLQKYETFLTRNFIERSTCMRWCPSPGCNRVAMGSGITTVACVCGLPFCFQCGEEAHDPATCDMLSKWQEKCQSESETANWILANTKKCPKCHCRIEKNQGCNHMNCKMCKHEFCWICMGDWALHGQSTGGYYKCNKYDPTVPADTAVERAKAELDRYLHYYQRYHGHDSALKFASKQREDAEARMTQLQEAERSAWIDVQFIKQAVEQVIECRRVLKYTYVLGHFLADGTAEKELYEHQQEMLEKHTEQLSELTEAQISLSDEERTHVVNLTRVTERFMSSMLSTMKEALDNGTGPLHVPAVAVSAEGEAKGAPQ